MASLVHFYYNNCLFKCNKKVFGGKIIGELTKLLLGEVVHDSQTRLLKSSGIDLHGVGKCIICAHVIPTVIKSFVTGPFLICDNCCFECIGVSAFAKFFVPRSPGDMYSQWFVYDTQKHACVTLYDTVHVSQAKSVEFVKKSHKLIHRFYHDTQILFLLSIKDEKSYCYGLLVDVMFYILKFIY